MKSALLLLNRASEVRLLSGTPERGGDGAVNTRKFFLLLDFILFTNYAKFLCHFGCTHHLPEPIFSVFIWVFVNKIKFSHRWEFPKVYITIPPRAVLTFNISSSMKIISGRHKWSGYTYLKSLAGVANIKENQSNNNGHNAIR